MLLAKNWWLFLLRGVLALIFGIAALFFPAAAFLSLVFVFGIFAFVDGVFTVWAIVTGLFEIITAVRLRKAIKGELWYILAGLASVIFGVLVLIYPISGAVAIGLLLGIYAIIFGIILIALSLGLRKFKRVAVI
jgi:uncharacterized membrane protein HdeD (DUF308 family)